MEQILIYDVTELMKVELIKVELMNEEKRVRHLIGKRRYKEKEND